MCNVDTDVSRVGQCLVGKDGQLTILKQCARQGVPIVLLVVIKAIKRFCSDVYGQQIQFRMLCVLGCIETNLRLPGGWKHRQSLKLWKWQGLILVTDALSISAEFKKLDCGTSTAERCIATVKIQQRATSLVIRKYDTSSKTDYTVKHHRQTFAANVQPVWKQVHSNTENIILSQERNYYKSQFGL